MNDPQSIFVLAALLGAVGMWLMLPRVGARLPGRFSGGLLASVSLGMFASQVPGLDAWLATGVFYVLAGVTVVAAAMMVTVRNPLYSAIWFGLSLLGTAGLFLFQGAQFLAVATIVVYAGAILVTFLFVLMLAQPKGEAAYDRMSWEAMVSATSGAVLAGILSMTVTSVLSGPGAPEGPAAAVLEKGVLAEQHMASIGVELFTRHLIAVEVAGLLLLAALVGAAVIVGQRAKPTAVDASCSNHEHRGRSDGP